MISSWIDLKLVNFWQNIQIWGKKSNSLHKMQEIGKYL